MNPLDYLLFTALAVFVYVWHRRATRLSISYIPGPSGASWMYGNVKDFVYQANVGDMDFSFLKQFGRVWRMRSPLGTDVLMTADPKALQHVLQKSDHRYTKRVESVEFARMTMGRGIVWATGAAHERQRKIITPAFTNEQIRSFVPVFRAGAAKLTQKWKDEVFIGCNDSKTFPINRWCSRVTIDMLGETTFDYNFGALDNTENEVSTAFHTMFADSFLRPPAWDIIFKRLWYYIPKPIIQYMDYIPTKEYKRFRRALKVVNEVSRQLIDQKMSLLLAESQSSKDVFSILVRANLSHNPKSRLSDEELISQMATLVFAGHITTATTLTWMLHELALHPAYQAKIRQEIAEARIRLRERGADDFSMDELENLTFVAAALKETLRFHPPVFHIYRNAAADDVIPLETPIKTTTGQYVSEVPVAAGQQLILSICAYQRLPELWGEDADQWNPMRFIDGDVDKESKMGLYANLMVFAAGIRGCLGWRFTVLESLAIIVDLVENFTFEPTEDSDKVVRMPTGLMSAWIRGRESEGPQLWLKVTPIS